MHCPSLAAGAWLTLLDAPTLDGEDRSQMQSLGHLYVLIILAAYLLKRPPLHDPPQVCDAYNHPATCVSIAFFDSSYPEQVWKSRHLESQVSLWHRKAGTQIS